MAYRLKPDESLSRGVRRIARDQIDKALDGLTGLSGDKTDAVVHGARKRFKKLRAVLRLARPGLGRKRFERENRRFRDAGRPLSEVRDAGVLVETFDRLIERFGAPGHPEVAADVRSALLDRENGVHERVLQEDKALAVVTASIQKARRAARRLQTEGDDWRVLRAGLKGIYKAGYRGFKAAAESPTDENLHECRKRIKDLWYALDILQPVRPDFTRPLAERARQLADDLGDDHDLAVLRDVLSEPDASFGDGPAVETLVPLIERRRAELQRHALELGRIVYSETPAEFVARIGVYWRAWRSESEAAGYPSRHSPGR